MVCTGDKLIYGIQMTLEEASKYVLKYIKSHVSEQNYEEIESELNDRDDDSDKFYYLSDILEQLEKAGLPLYVTIIKPPCCLFGFGDHTKVYLGVELSSNHIHSRWEPLIFSSIEDYKKKLTEGVNKAEKLLQTNKEKYLADLAKFVPKTKNKPKIYTMPNDCYSCS